MNELSPSIILKLHCMDMSDLRKAYNENDKLEALVAEIAPTAEFTKTMLAEEFRQSQSSQEAYSTDYVLDEDDEEN